MSLKDSWKCDLPGGGSGLDFGGGIARMRWEKRWGTVREDFGDGLRFWEKHE